MNVELLVTIITAVQGTIFAAAVPWAIVVQSRLTKIETLLQRQKEDRDLLIQLVDKCHQLEIRILKLERNDVS